MASTRGNAEPAAILGWHERFSVDFAAIQCVNERGFDRLHASMSAHFRDEPPARLQRAPDCRNDFIGPQHPVQGRITEYCIEFVVELQPFASQDASVHAQFARGLNLHFAGIDSDDVASDLHQFGCEHAVTAPQIEDSFAGPWR